MTALSPLDVPRVEVDLDTVRNALADAAEYREPAGHCARCAQSDDGRCDECAADEQITAQYRQAAVRLDAKVLALTHDGCGHIPDGGISTSPGADDRLRRYMAACRAAGLTGWRLEPVAVDQAMSRQLGGVTCGLCRITPADLARALTAGHPRQDDAPEPPPPAKAVRRRTAAPATRSLRAAE